MSFQVAYGELQDDTQIESGSTSNKLATEILTTTTAPTTRATTTSTTTTTEALPPPNCENYTAYEVADYSHANEKFFTALESSNSFEECCKKVQDQNIAGWLRF